MMESAGIWGGGKIMWRVFKGNFRRAQKRRGGGEGDRNEPYQMLLLLQRSLC